VKPIEDVPITPQLQSRHLLDYSILAVLNVQDFLVGY
jgi:hypothetical protein